MTIKTQDRVITYIQTSGRGTALEPLSINRHGLGDMTDNTIPGRGTLFGRDEFGRPEVKVEFDEPPTGLNEATITFDPEATIDYLDDQVLQNAKFGLWRFFIPTGRLGNYTNWTTNGDLEFLAGAKITSGVKGGREKDYSGQPMVNTYDLAWRNTLTVLPPAIVSQTTTETEDINDVAFLSDLDPQLDIPGYPGPDKVGFAATNAGAAVTANVLFTVDGGSTWAALATDPFLADEHIIAVDVRFVSATAYRVVVLRSTVDAANPPEIAFTDITLGGEAGAISWTTTDLGSTNNDPGEALGWLLSGRLYAGGGGDIFVSTDSGETFTQILTGAQAISDFAIDFDDNVWATTATNGILKEAASNRGTFDSLVGPTGGATMNGIAIARDSFIYAGNDTSIFLNDNTAATTGGWTEKKDFGANHLVRQVQTVDGESQILRVLVDDTTAEEGDIWYSLDGGNTWVEVTNLANSGYLGWYISEIDPNLLFIVGGEDTTTGIIHKLQPA